MTTDLEAWLTLVFIISRKFDAVHPVTATEKVLLKLEKVVSFHVFDHVFCATLNEQFFNPNKKLWLMRSNLKRSLIYNSAEDD